MKELRPELREVARDWWFVVWEGPVRTVLREYQVRIQYIRPSFLDDGCWVTGGPINPEVWVVSPELEIRSGERRLPHTYLPKARPESQAPLCLHLWKDGEWSTSDYIAETIVPWTAEWLHFYEGWLVTGTWHGGGIHPGDEEFREWEARAGRRDKGVSSPAGPPASYRPSADNFIGRRTGTFASFALMEGASRASSAWPSWPAWRKRPWAERLSLPASTWLPGLPPAESLLSA
jgi:hypothetical protein